MRTLSRRLFLSVAIGAMVTVGSLLPVQQCRADENTQIATTQDEQFKIEDREAYTEDQVNRFMLSFCTHPAVSREDTEAEDNYKTKNYSYAIGWGSDPSDGSKGDEQMQLRKWREMIRMLKIRHLGVEANKRSSEMLLGQKNYDEWVKDGRKYPVKQYSRILYNRPGFNL